MKDMEEQKKTQVLGATFYGSVTFNGPMFDIHDNHHVHIHSEQPQKSTSLHASEEEVKQSILSLLEATGEDGKKIFTEKSQWYGVYKVLSQCQDYPSKMTDFCDIMKNMGMDQVSPACDYASMRKVPNNVAFPTPKVTLWHNYQDKAEAKFKKQITVAVKLMELLGR